MDQRFKHFLLDGFDSLCEARKTDFLTHLKFYPEKVLDHLKNMMGEWCQDFATANGTMASVSIPNDAEEFLGHLKEYFRGELEELEAVA